MDVKTADGISAKSHGVLEIVVVVAVAIALLTPSLVLANNSNPRLTGGPGHPLPVPAPGAKFAPAPAGAHLTYYGGRVVSNLQVVQVLYGSGNYLPQVSSTASPSMATFYQGVLNSAYIDWLSEYNTSITGSGGVAGTNQSIGRGSFAGLRTITPSAANSGSTIDDSQIQNELAAQIAAGNLPAPTTDVAGNNNTYYAIFFPHGVAITSGGSGSCVAGGFCAYHGTIANAAGHEIYYGVHPDMQAGSGCDTGCGSGTPFQNYTSVASHEMIETITDPEVALATSFGPPLGWYDSNNRDGEIGDICNAQQETIVGGDSVTYTVQKEWSNSANACIVSRGLQAIFQGWAPVPGNGTTLVSDAAEVYQNKLYLFGIGINDHGHYVNVLDGSTWSGWAPVPGNGTTLVSDAAEVYQNKLYLFGIGINDHGHYVNVLDGSTWSGWAPVPGNGTTLVSDAAEVYQNKLYLFGIGINDHGHYVNVLDGSTWSGWAPVPGNGTTLVSDAAEVYQNKLYLFGIGINDHGHYVNVLDGPTWSGWAPVPGNGTTLVSDAAEVYQNKLYLFGIGINDHGHYVNVLDGPTWSGWAPVPGNGTTLVSDAAEVYQNKLYLFGIGINDHKHYVNVAQ